MEIRIVPARLVQVGARKINKITKGREGLALSPAQDQRSKMQEK